ncbi:MAG TPA: hypothetical protein VEK33_20560 [Terriglobales bacterium]|nr:hypothetical protein [Terriglobales bacterium]
MTEKPLAFLSLVKLLETAVGHKTGYSMLDPFPCMTVEAGDPAIIPIQKAGRTIAQHMGLGDLTFVISITTHDKSTAGHIELNRDGSDVFVELATDICGYKDAVLATLCHELSHKYLHVHGIRHGIDKIEQEYLTDVTAIYVGLGKIMLNGCECQSSHPHMEGGRAVTTTHTLKTGYISRECFAFVYRLVCAMRDIPREEFMKGLSTPASYAISNYERDYPNWFNPEFRNSDEMGRVAEHLREKVMACQESAAEHDQLVRRLEESIRAIYVMLHESHKPLKEALRRIEGLSEVQPNPHLRYLTCLETRESVAQYTAASQDQIDRLKPRLGHIESIAPFVSADAHDAPTDILECPLDGTKLRVPSGRTRILVSCPSCKYKFLATTMFHYDEQSKNRRSRFVQSLKSVFRPGN